MSEWKREFQYLLDRKILTRDELGYLFGQINSIIESKKKQLQSQLTTAQEREKRLRALCTRENAVLSKAIERKSWAMVWVVKDSLGEQALKEKP